MELEQKAQQRPFSLFPGERIGAEMFLTIVYLEQVQPFFLVTVEEVNYFIRRQVMPVLADQSVHSLGSALFYFCSTSLEKLYHNGYGKDAIPGYQNHEKQRPVLSKK